MKLIQFLFGAEHMQYMMLLGVAANLKSEIFKLIFFLFLSMLLSAKYWKMSCSCLFFLVQWKMHDDEVC